MRHPGTHPRQLPIGLLPPLSVAPALSAQVPAMLHSQGRIAVDGANFNGAGRRIPLAGVGGSPPVAHTHTAPGDLCMAWMRDASGTAWSPWGVLDGTGTTGSHPSPDGVNGLAGIASGEVTNGTLRFIRDTTPPSGLSFSRIALPP